MKPQAMALLATMISALLAQRLWADVQIDSVYRAVSATASPPAVTAGSNSTQTGNYQDSQTASQHNIGGSSNSNATATESQNSSISTGTFEGTGTSSTAAHSSGGFADSLDGTGYSQFIVNFTVTSPQPFTLTGTLSEQNTWYGGSPGTVNAYVQFKDASQTSYLYTVSETIPSSPDRAGTYSGSTPISYSTILSPGTYGLQVITSSDSKCSGVRLEDDSTAGFQFTAVVPEPASMNLGFLALAPLARRRRRTP
jgi:hypothetical protein